jgi:hypothetical protein
LAVFRSAEPTASPGRDLQEPYSYKIGPGLLVHRLAPAKYGITRVPTDYFHYKEYRYTSLNDALAEAKRQQPAVPSDGREQSGLR